MGLSFYFSVDMFAPPCAMCCGLCGKLCFIILLVVWACDVTRIVLSALTFPASKSGHSCVQDEQRWFWMMRTLEIGFNLVTVLGLGV